MKPILGSAPEKNMSPSLGTNNPICRGWLHSTEVAPKDVCHSHTNEIQKTHTHQTQIYKLIPFALFVIPKGAVAQRDSAYRVSPMRHPLDACFRIIEKLSRTVSCIVCNAAVPHTDLIDCDDDDDGAVVRMANEKPSMRLGRQQMVWIGNKKLKCISSWSGLSPPRLFRWVPCGTNIHTNLLMMEMTGIRDFLKYYYICISSSEADVRAAWYDPFAVVWRRESMKVTRTVCVLCMWFIFLV